MVSRDERWCPFDSGIGRRGDLHDVIQAFWEAVWLSQSHSGDQIDVRAIPDSLARLQRRQGLSSFHGRLLQIAGERWDGSGPPVNSCRAY
jgi:hypothetical protein